MAGAGETAELAIHALHKHGATEVRCINRTLSSAQDLAQRYGYEARPWGELADALAHADAVITATGSPHPVIYADDVAPVLGATARESRWYSSTSPSHETSIWASPPSPGVVLHDIDRLEATLDQNLVRRFEAVPKVEEIVGNEAQLVMEWLHGREATDLLAGLHEHARAVADAELSGALRKLEGHDKGTEEVITRMANRIVGKLLHQPTKQLKARASSEDFDVYYDAIVDLFGLQHERLPRSGGVKDEGGGG